MAFSYTAQNSRRRGVSVGTLSEINVVPLVDVVLVLLIIFMLTAHVMESGFDIEAPQVKQVRDTAEDLPQVSITRDGKLFLNGDPVKNINLLASEIRARFKNASAVYVLGDRRVQYEQVVSVISLLSEAKFNISLLAKPLDIPNKP